MLKSKLTLALGLVLFIAFSGSVFAVKGMNASKTPAVSPSPSPIVSPSPSLSPSPSVTPTPTPSPSIKPSIKPTAKPSATIKPSPSATLVTTTSTTTTVITTTVTNNNPNLQSLDPANPAFSTPMTIKGSGFGNNAGIINVYNTKGEPQPYPPTYSWSDSEIKTHSPFFASDQEYQLEIQTADGKKSNRLTVKSGGGQPQLESISPSNAKPGEELTLKGSRYDGNPGRVEFFLNYPNVSGSGEIVSWSETEIKVKIPANLEPGKEYGIQITNGRGGQSSFTFYTLGN